MKKRNWILLLLIAAVIAVFVGYRQFDAVRTDKKAPVISIDDTQMMEFSVQTPKSEFLRGVTASDKRDGDLTKKIVIEDVRLVDENGLTEVSYAVADKAGNVAKASRKVRYTDYRSPKFDLNRPLIYERGDDFDIMQNVFATDVLDGDIQHRIRATAVTEGAISKEGVHKVHFQVANSLGDLTEMILPVEVLEQGTYAADLSLTDYMIYLPRNAAFHPVDYLREFVYKAEETSLENGIPEDFSLETKGNVITQTPGVYSVEYRVTYTIRHDTNPEFDQHFTGYSKLIVVVEG